MRELGAESFEAREAATQTIRQELLRLEKDGREEALKALLAALSRAAREASDPEVRERLTLLVSPYRAGGVVWERQMPNGWGVSVRVTGGTVLAYRQIPSDPILYREQGVLESQVEARSLADGEIRWQHRCPGVLSHLDVVGDEKEGPSVFMAGPGGLVVRNSGAWMGLYRAKDGRPVWEDRAVGGMSGFLQGIDLRDGKILLGGNDDEKWTLALHRVEDGKQLWHVSGEKKADGYLEKLALDGDFALVSHNNSNANETVVAQYALADGACIGRVSRTWDEGSLLLPRNDSGGVGGAKLFLCQAGPTGPKAHPFPPCPDLMSRIPGGVIVKDREAGRLDFHRFESGSFRKVKEVQASRGVHILRSDGPAVCVGDREGEFLSFIAYTLHGEPLCRVRMKGGPHLFPHDAAVVPGGLVACFFVREGAETGSYCLRLYRTRDLVGVLPSGD